MIHITGKPRGIHHAYTSLSGGVCHQLVWIALTSLDNKAERFWNTFLDGLSLWNLVFVQRERQLGFPTSEKKIQSFLERLAQQAIDTPVVIEVNNQHRIHSQPVQAFLKALVDFRAENLFVMLLSLDQEEDAEADEALQPYKYHYFLEEEERKYYVEQEISLNVQQFKQVRDFTDGWAPAVVVFAQQHLQADELQFIFDDFDAYIFRWISDYFRSRYSEEVGRLFTQITLLDGITPELFEKLSGWDGDEIMKKIETSPFLRLNLDDNRFYLCKHLRRHLLRSLHLLTEEERYQILVDTGDWYRDQGNKIEAIAYYRKAEANLKILHMLQQWESPPTRETADCYIDTISSLPSSFLERHPMLRVMWASCLLVQNRYEQVKVMLPEFCFQYDQGDNTPEELLPILGEAYILWAYCAYVEADMESVLKRYQRAVELLPNGSSLIPTKINYRANGPSVQLLSPDPGSARKSLQYVALMEPYLIKTQAGSSAGMSFLAEAELLYYTHNFREVENLAFKAAYKALEYEQYDVACSAYFLLMRLDVTRGKASRLTERLERLRESAAKANYPAFFCMPDVAEAWLALVLGRKQDVAEWIIDDKLYRKLVKPWDYGRDQVIRCGYLLVSEFYEEVLTFADVSLGVMEHRGYKILALHLMLMKAIAWNRLGDQAEALSLFEEVYRWIHANHFIMLMAEYDAYILQLVTAYRASPNTLIPDEWLLMIESKTKSHRTGVYNVRSKLQQKKGDKESPLNSLTNLEQKTLIMLCDSMTAKEIAQAQNRTELAVRKMMQKIYAKLGAKDRSAAVRIATEWDIQSLIKI